MLYDGVAHCFDGDLSSSSCALCQRPRRGTLSRARCCTLGAPSLVSIPPFSSQFALRKGFGEVNSPILASRSRCEATYRIVRCTIYRIRFAYISHFRREYIAPQSGKSSLISILASQECVDQFCLSLVKTHLVASSQPHFVTVGYVVFL